MIFYRRHRALCGIGGSLRRPGRCRPAVWVSRPHPAGSFLPAAPGSLRDRGALCGDPAAAAPLSERAARIPRADFYRRHRALCGIGGFLRRPGRCRPAVWASRPHPAGALRFGAAVRQNRPAMGGAGAFSGTTKGKRFIKYYILYKIKGGKSGARSLRPALFRCAEKVRRVGSPSGPAARSAAMCAGGRYPDGEPGAVRPAAAPVCGGRHASGRRKTGRPPAAAALFAVRWLAC